MTIDRNTLLFFDASCLIAVAGSPNGGSGFLLSLCAKRLIKGAISQPVLLEAQRNIQTKLGDESLNTFYRFLTVTPLTLASIPGKSELKRIGSLITSKDAHVVGAAMVIKADFLLTLDKRLNLQVNQAKLGIQAISPGDFIKSILPSHTDYPSSKD